MSLLPFFTSGKERPPRRVMNHHHLPVICHRSFCTTGKVGLNFSCPSYRPWPVINKGIICIAHPNSTDSMVIFHFHTCYLSLWSVSVVNAVFCHGTRIASFFLMESLTCDQSSGVTVVSTTQPGRGYSRTHHQVPVHLTLLFSSQFGFPYVVKTAKELTCDMFAVPMANIY